MIKAIKAVTRKWRATLPPDRFLKEMVETDWRWHDYQSWLYRYAYISQQNWLSQRKNIARWPRRPCFSVVTPVYNVSATFLSECVESVLFQTYPHWEMLLVDDGSTAEETLKQLHLLRKIDSRIKVFLQGENNGICETTNFAISQAKGEFVVFLDHDDKISTNAFYEFACAVNTSDKQIDILYSDRDMLTPDTGVRFMYLFKPGWASETIFSSNYLCHLTAYRRTLLESLGGVDKETEGSQDHDLILRAAEYNPHVYHVPKVLYQWRQHEESVSLNPESKNYAFRAAELSIEKAMRRRGLRGEVTELSSLWRGNYRVKLEFSACEEIGIFRCEDILHQMTGALLKKALEKHRSKKYIVFLDESLTDTEENNLTLLELVSWFQIENIGIVSGKIVDEQDMIIHAGLISSERGEILSIYQTKEDDVTAGYMAWAKTVHNVSIPHPGCFAMRNDDISYYADNLHEDEDLFTLSLMMRRDERRIVFTPFARFYTDDGAAFTRKYKEMRYRRPLRPELEKILGQGDPYFSRNLSVVDNDIALNFSKDPFNEWELFEKTND